MRPNWNKSWLSEEGELGRLAKPFKKLFSKKKPKRKNHIATKPSGKRGM